MNGTHSASERRSSGIKAASTIRTYKPCDVGGLLPKSLRTGPLLLRASRQVSLKLRKLADEGRKGFSGGLSDFIPYVKNGAAQILSRNQLRFFERSKVCSQGFLGGRWDEPSQLAKANGSCEKSAKDLDGPFPFQYLHRVLNLIQALCVVDSHQTSPRRVGIPRLVVASLDRLRDHSFRQ